MMFRWLARNHQARKRLQALNRRRPWQRSAPKDAQHPLGLVGMLGDGESKLLFELARTCFSGRGTVVDAGSFLGKSASLLAAGLRANRISSAVSKKIHCFDSFQIYERHTVEFIQQQLGHQVAIGDSTRIFFDRQVEPVRDLLQVHAGDFLQTHWSAGPIELLLVDIAKSEQLWSHVLSELFPSLIPGVSIIIHQDYHHAWLPHIHVVMEFLHPFFELVIPRVDGSAVFLMKAPIPPAMLEKAIRNEFSLEERVALMDAAINRIPTTERFLVRCAKVVLLNSKEQRLDAMLTNIEQLEQICAAEGSNDDLPVMRQCLADMQATFLENVGWNALRSENWVLALDTAKHLRAAQGNDELDGNQVLMFGCSLIGLGRFQEAEEWLRRSPVAISSGSPYIAIELARSVLYQGRHDEAEHILLKNLEHTCPGEADHTVLSRHIDVLLEVFASRGNPAQDRDTASRVSVLIPGNALLERLSDARGMERRPA